MEGYASDREQIESLKKWWKENGKVLIVALALGFGAIFGGKAWVDYKNSQAESAALEFEQLLEELKQKNNQAVVERGNHIIDTFPKTPYAALAALALAKIKVEEGDYVSAREKLQWILDHARQPDMLLTARMRLAKVMITQGEAAQAVTLLDAVDPENFLSSYEEIKGDAYLATGEHDKARLAYKKAFDAASSGMPSQELQMKLDDLGSD